MPAKDAARKDEPLDRAKYPNLAAERDMDQAEHEKRARAAGMSAKEAARHAAEDVRSGDKAR